MAESIDFPKDLPEPGSINRVQGVGHRPHESEKRRFAQLLEKDEEERRKKEEHPPPEPRDEEGKPPKESSPANGRGKFIDVTV